MSKQKLLLCSVMRKDCALRCVCLATMQSGKKENKALINRIIISAPPDFDKKCAAGRFIMPTTHECANIKIGVL